MKVGALSMLQKAAARLLVDTVEAIAKQLGLDVRMRLRQLVPAGYKTSQILYLSEGPERFLGLEPH